MLEVRQYSKKIHGGNDMSKDKKKKYELVDEEGYVLLRYEWEE